MVIACDSGGQAPAEKRSPEPGPAPLTVAEPPLDRRALLGAVAEAASATILHEDDAAVQRTLDGKRFELRLRFGCEGGAGSAISQARGWSFDEKTRVLRVRIEPDLLRSASVEALVGSEFEVVEGFWIPRPWLLAAGCPAAAAAPPSPEAIDQAAAPQVAAPPGPAPEPTVGIAQIYTATDSRTRRRNDRAFELTIVLDAEQRPSATGYDLVLAGRLKALPSGRVISCTGKSPDRAPRCLISAQFDRTAVEPPGGGEALATWNAG